MLQSAQFLWPQWRRVRAIPDSPLRRHSRTHQTFPAQTFPAQTSIFLTSTSQIINIPNPNPNVNLPNINPNLNLPNVPGNINVPNVNVPNVNLDVPEIADIVPDFNVPEVADIVPDFNPPKIDVPKINTPEHWPGRWWWRRPRPSIAGRGRSTTGSARYGHGGFAQWVNCNAESRD